MAPQTVVVTGSTSGIGLGVATAFAEAGNHVIINGRAARDGHTKIVEDLTARCSGRVHFIAADVSIPQEMEMLVAETEKEFGSLDVLVLNAGIQHTDLVQDFPVERWDAIISVNLSSVFYGARAALPGMLKRNHGRIISIASVHGLVASAQKAAYVAAKHGVVGLTKVIALETAKTGVTANAICPGWVLTPLVEQQIKDRAAKNGTSIEEETRKLVDEKQPSGKFVTVEQLAALAQYLASDQTAQLTGQAIAMDGGWVSQ